MEKRTTSKKLAKRTNLTPLTEEMEILINDHENFLKVANMPRGKRNQNKQEDIGSMNRSGYSKATENTAIKMEKLCQNKEETLKPDLFKAPGLPNKKNIVEKLDPVILERQLHLMTQFRRRKENFRLHAKDSCTNSKNVLSKHLNSPVDETQTSSTQEKMVIESIALNLRNISPDSRPSFQQSDTTFSTGQPSLGEENCPLDLRTPQGLDASSENLMEYRSNSMDDIPEHLIAMMNMVQNPVSPRDINSLQERHQSPIAKDCLTTSTKPNNAECLKNINVVQIPKENFSSDFGNSALQAKEKQILTEFTNIQEICASKHSPSVEKIFERKHKTSKKDSLLIYSSKRNKSNILGEDNNDENIIPNEMQRLILLPPQQKQISPVITTRMINNLSENSSDSIIELQTTSISSDSDNEILSPSDVSISGFDLTDLFALQSAVSIENEFLPESPIESEILINDSSYNSASLLQNMTMEDDCTVEQHDSDQNSETESSEISISSDNVYSDSDDDIQPENISNSGGTNHHKGSFIFIRQQKSLAKSSESVVPPILIHDNEIPEVTTILEVRSAGENISIQDESNNPLVTNEGIEDITLELLCKTSGDMDEGVSQDFPEAEVEMISENENDRIYVAVNKKPSNVKQVVSGTPHGLVEDSLSKVSEEDSEYEYLSDFESDTNDCAEILPCSDDVPAKDKLQAAVPESTKPRAAKPVKEPETVKNKDETIAKEMSNAVKTSTLNNAQPDAEISHGTIVHSVVFTSNIQVGTKIKNKLKDILSNAECSHEPKVQAIVGKLNDTKRPEAKKKPNGRLLNDENLLRATLPPVVPSTIANGPKFKIKINSKGGVSKPESSLGTITQPNLTSNVTNRSESKLKIFTEDRSFELESLLRENLQRGITLNANKRPESKITAKDILSNADISPETNLQPVLDLLNVPKESFKVKIKTKNTSSNVEILPRNILQPVVPSNTNKDLESLNLKVEDALLVKSSKLLSVGLASNIPRGSGSKAKIKSKDDPSTGEISLRQKLNPTIGMSNVTQGPESDTKIKSIDVLSNVESSPQKKVQTTVTTQIIQESDALAKKLDASIANTLQHPIFKHNTSKIENSSQLPATLTSKTEIQDEESTKYKLNINSIKGPQDTDYGILKRIAIVGRSNGGFSRPKTPGKPTFVIRPKTPVIRPMKLSKLISNQRTNVNSANTPKKKLSNAQKQRSPPLVTHESITKVIDEISFNKNRNTDSPKTGKMVSTPITPKLRSSKSYVVTSKRKASKVITPYKKLMSKTDLTNSKNARFRVNTPLPIRSGKTELANSKNIEPKGITSYKIRPQQIPAVIKYEKNILGVKTKQIPLHLKFGTFGIPTDSPRDRSHFQTSRIDQTIPAEQLSSFVRAPKVNTPRRNQQKPTETKSVKKNTEVESAVNGYIREWVFSNPQAYTKNIHYPKLSETSQTTTDGTPALTKWSSEVTEISGSVLPLSNSTHTQDEPQEINPPLLPSTIVNKKFKSRVLSSLEMEYKETVLQILSLENKSISLKKQILEEMKNTYKRRNKSISGNCSKP